MPPTPDYTLPAFNQWFVPWQETPPNGSQVPPSTPPSRPQDDPAATPPSPPAAYKEKAEAPSQLGNPRLRVCCLGALQVYQDEEPIEEWTSNKSKAIFKYLVTHRERPIPKEVLMEWFWPDTHPDAARNNLNVAVYGLRQTLRATHPSFSHVLYQSDCYLLNPEIDIWLDCEHFSQQIARAQSLEQSGDVDGAIAVYTQAEALYGGDFLEEDRYEEWVIPMQQYYRDEYIQILEHLGNYYLAQEDFQACIQYARKMVAIEPCDEEAHRRLMCCYQSLGQSHLAQRQFQICEKSLQEQLGVTPSTDTMEVYESLYPDNEE
jgi:DNA-binding SARP family transcriptional activator